MVNFTNRQGTICNTDWDSSDSNLVCTQLGYVDEGHTESDLSRFNFPPGPVDRIWLTGVQCAGSETRIQDCNADAWGDVEAADCGHGDDVAVSCYLHSGMSQTEIVALFVF